MFVKMNDLPVQSGLIIPLISRPRVRGASLNLAMQLTGWDLDLSFLHDWHRSSGA
jgi:peptide/nickel transport system substrate-binding protein